MSNPCLLGSWPPIRRSRGGQANDPVQVLVLFDEQFVGHALSAILKARSCAVVLRDAEDLAAVPANDVFDLVILAARPLLRDDYIENLRLKIHKAKLAVFDSEAFDCESERVGIDEADALGLDGYLPAHFTPGQIADVLQTILARPSPFQSLSASALTPGSLAQGAPT